jgi:hypothetical protein
LAAKKSFISLGAPRRLPRKSGMVTPASPMVPNELAMVQCTSANAYCEPNSRGLTTAAHPDSWATPTTPMSCTSATSGAVNSATAASSTPPRIRGGSAFKRPVHSGHSSSRPSPSQVAHANRPHRAQTRVAAAWCTAHVAPEVAGRAPKGCSSTSAGPSAPAPHRPHMLRPGAITAPHPGHRIPLTPSVHAAYRRDGGRVEGEGRSRGVEEGR